MISIGDGWGRRAFPTAYSGRKDVRLRVRSREVGHVMYHPHSDEMVQMAMGKMGLFIIHPKEPNSCLSTGFRLPAVRLRH